MAILDQICTKIRNDRFEFSQHATDQSTIRHICANPEGPDMIPTDDFAPYADASRKHVCPKMVKNDLRVLRSAVEKHEEFADKRIAHWDKGEPSVIPKFEELDDCIKLLDQTYVKYHLLFFAEGTSTLMPTYQYEWKKIFLEPWLKTGFGSAKGRIHIGEDFDDELPDFKEYME